MPFSVGPHPAMYGPFHLFRFPIDELPDVACAESLGGRADEAVPATAGV